MSPHLFSAGDSGSTTNGQLQHFGFPLQTTFQKVESASYCTKNCDSEIRRLEAQLEDYLSIQEDLLSKLRWALEAKHVAEIALAEHVRQTRSMVDNLVASSTPRGPLDWMYENVAKEVDSDSLSQDRSLFSQPLIASSREQKMVDHRHERGKLCDEVTKDLEMQVAKLSCHFQLLAECYSGTALRLEQAQRDVSRLRTENLELQASSAELFNRCQLKDRKLQQVLLEKSEVSTSLGLPSRINYGISSSIGDSTSSRVSSPDILSPYRVHISESDAFEDKAVGPVSCRGVNIHAAGLPTSEFVEASLSQLRVSSNCKTVEADKTISISAPKGASRTGNSKVLSERTSVSALMIPKPDLKSWCLPHKVTSRELHAQQPESPITDSPTWSKTSSESASAAGTPLKFICDDVAQSTDCTLLLDASPATLKTACAAATDVGSVNKIATAANGQVAAMLPRSISVRASGTSVVEVRTNLSCQTQKKRSVSPESTESIHSLVLSPVSPLGPHRLRLSPTQEKEGLPSSGSGKEGADPDEDLEWVYDQGMYKTELCNKWQEGGTCPYANRCRFAHGVEELRPVLRHPRYKTELCRMVANGEKCPYGHRCHFRHSMTKEERTSLFCKFQVSV